MIDKKRIETLAQEHLDGTDRFIVSILVSTDNVIRVFMDGDTGVNISHCVALSRHIESNLDREKEDYELNVASAGADRPFVLERQYINNIGNSVKVTTLEGKVTEGILKTVEKEQIEVLEEIRSKKQRIKKIVFGDLVSIPFDSIKETKRIITY